MVLFYLHFIHITVGMHLSPTTIVRCGMIYDHMLCAGFAFVTFESPAVVERVLEVHFHEINNKMVECKQAKPKEELSPPPSRGQMCFLLLSCSTSSNFTAVSLLSSSYCYWYTCFSEVNVWLSMAIGYECVDLWLYTSPALGKLVGGPSDPLS